MDHIPENKPYVDLVTGSCAVCFSRYCVCIERQNGTWENHLPVHQVQYATKDKWSCPACGETFELRANPESDIGAEYKRLKTDHLYDDLAAALENIESSTEFRDRAYEHLAIIAPEEHEYNAPPINGQQYCLLHKLWENINNAGSV